MKISPVGAELHHADGQTDRQTDKTKSLVTSSTFANAPTKATVFAYCRGSRTTALETLHSTNLLQNCCAAYPKHVGRWRWHHDLPVVRVLVRTSIGQTLIGDSRATGSFLRSPAEGPMFLLLWLYRKTISCGGRSPTSICITYMTRWASPLHTAAIYVRLIVWTCRWRDVCGPCQK